MPLCSYQVASFNCRPDREHGGCAILSYINYYVLIVYIPPSDYISLILKTLTEVG